MSPSLTVDGQAQRSVTQLHAAPSHVQSTALPHTPSGRHVARATEQRMPVAKDAVTVHVGSAKVVAGGEAANVLSLFFS